MSLPHLTIRYLIRCALIVLAFAAMTYGLLEWRDRHFSLSGFWPLHGSLQLHPLHLLILGLALLPATLWEMFLLDLSQRPDSAGEDGDRTS